MRRLLLLAVLATLFLRPATADDLKPFVCKDDGFKIGIPADFAPNSNVHNAWEATREGGACTIQVTTVKMAGVPPRVMYDANIKTYQGDTAHYTAVKPVQVSGVPGALAFRCEEVSKGKGDADMHRWHLFVFGNNRSYTLVFGGPYGTFTKGVGTTYDAVLKSFALVPAK